MKNIKPFLKLIRVTNLIFIALTQYLVQYALIIPILKSASAQPTLSDFNFFLLVLSTVLIAAAGYVINDYFDLKIDSFNKPRRITIGKNFKPRGAIIIHFVLNFIAVAIGIYLAYCVGNFNLAFIQPVTVGLLWFYSTGYKKQALTGNVVVSFLTALVVMLVVLFESQLFHPADVLVMQAARTIFIVTFFYFVFAFLISMIREIVKDIEDREGDENYGCRTLPIVMGLKKTKWVLYVLLFILIMGIGGVQFYEMQGGDLISMFYILITVQAPLIAVTYFLFKAQQAKEFAFISTLVKLIMLMGILTMAYFYLLIQSMS